MGTNLSSILTTKEVSFDLFTNKKLVVDAYNVLYQFLSTIRQQDGQLLKDSKGQVTSHLSGLFFRTTKLMKEKIKLAFVFDGIAPDLKKQERERRSELKKQAQRKYEEALKKEDLELMRKYASRTSSLTKEMVDEAIELIEALGLPVIKAPAEGEAQASYMVAKGEFYALVSQDTDGLLFGSSKLIRNLSVSKRKKKPGTQTYETVNPTSIDLQENLHNLNINRDQLIVVAMLCGTDFNVGGVKGIGPKKALLLIKKHKEDFETLFREAKWNDFFNFGWKKVFDLIKNMPTTTDYNLEWKNIDEDKIKEILVNRHEFSEERVDKTLQDLLKTQQQKGLSDFF